MLSFRHLTQWIYQQHSQLLVLLCLLTVVACGTDSPAPATATTPAATSIAAWSVQTQEMSTQRQWHGRLEPLRLVPVHAAGQGRIVQVNIKEGDHVRQGDILLRIEAPELRSRRTVLIAQQVVLNEQLSRWEKLLLTEYAAQNDVAQARIQVLQIDEELALLDAEIARHTIHAPVNGRVSGAVLDVGNNVSAGQVLLTLQDESSWGVRLAVPARESDLLGDASRLHLLTGIGETLILDRIIITAGTASGVVNAEIYVEQQANLQARDVTLHYDDNISVVLVPWTAVASDERGSWVAVIEGSPSVISRRIVQLGRAHAAGVEVLSGLSDGEIVVRYEPRSLPEGREVTARIAQP